MDLSSLNQFLKDLPEIRTAPGQVIQSTKGPDVCVELIRNVKHRGATAANELLVVVLSSVSETLKAENIPPSATAVFAALCSCLEQSNDAGLSTACCSALSMTLPRVPGAVLRIKCAECIGLVMRHVETAAEAAVSCLGQLIAASGPGTWKAVVPAYSYVLSLVVEEDLKLRKKSQTALVGIFKAFSGDEALVGVLQAASEALLQASGPTLSAPERTAQEAAKASNKQRRAAEDSIRTAVSRALRLMGVIKNVIGLLPEQVAQRVSSQVLSLFHLQQTLLTTSATEVLLSLSSTASAVTQEEILKALLSINALWDTNEATLEMSIVRLLEALTIGVERGDGGGGGNGAYVASVFHVLVPQLASRIEGVARTAADALVRIARECITEDVVLSTFRQGNRAAPIVSIISAVETSFGAQYFDSWELCLAVAQELISGLGRTGAPLASSLVEKIGELCAGVDDIIAASDSIESSRIAEVAQNTLGVCIQSLGPETVLERLPLEIEEALDGQAEGRTWMIPLLKMYMKGGRMAFWMSDIYPLIVRLGARCKAAKPQSRERSTLYALELQLWSTLPAFSSWAEDIPECFEYVCLPCAFALLSFFRQLCRSGRHRSLSFVLPMTNNFVHSLLRSKQPRCDADSSKLSLPLRHWMTHQVDDVDLSAEQPSTRILRTLRLATHWTIVSLPQPRREVSKIIGPCFEKREDVRLYVSQTIQRICVQTRRILMHAGEESGNPDPCTTDDGDMYDNEDGDDDLYGDHAYLGRFSAEAGQRRLAVLKAGSKAWLPMLLNAFVATHTSKRNHIQAAISGYSCICDSAVATKVFKSALTRLMKVANQLETGELGRDAVMEGGDNDTERYCTYLEAVYALLGGLDASALGIVYQLVSKDMGERDPAVQKKAYKLLQYLVEHRPDFYSQDFESLVERILQGSTTAMSASRGFRIKCLKSVILHLLTDQQNIDVSKVPFAASEVHGAHEGGVSSVDNARFVMTPMVSEIVLSIKESNKKTRAAAFDLFIEVASAVDESDPENGVVSLVHLILGGLVGSTSQMVSASVMALARILFDFTPSMMPMIHDLLPAVLLLLHSKSREVIKAVLGFLKIAIMRLDSDLLVQYTPQILEGTLIWAEDSKNKFRLKVRVILERLAKKVGFEALERHIPESHKSLLTHIRKETKRKDRSKSRRSEMDWDGRSFVETVNTKGGRSRAASKDPSVWQSDVFSQDSAGKSSKSMGRKSNRTHTRRTGTGVGFAEQGEADPLNLLDASTTRRMVGMNVRRSGHIEKERMEEDAITFEHDDGGKLIINEESKKKKRDRDAGGEDAFDSEDDSDDELLRGITGQELALRGSQSMARAKSYAGMGSSRYGDRGSKKTSRGSSVSGDRFRSNKAGGDVRGKSKLEPFAYYEFDKRAMNRRAHKAKIAKTKLAAVVNAGGKKRRRT